MYEGYRSRSIDHDTVIWRFYQRMAASPSAEIVIPLPDDAEQRTEAIASIDDYGEACWQQGRASAHDEHRSDTERIEEMRKTEHERWLDLCKLHARLEDIEKLATTAWREKRSISPEELRDALL